jgi:AbrB family looped-hinge helix DNA binding protein
MQLINDTSPLLLTTMTQRGQITVPARIRRMLAVKPRQQLGFEIKGNEVHLVPVTATLESIYGSVTPKNRPENFDALIHQAKRAKKVFNQTKQP